MKIICIGRNYGAHAKEMNAEIPSAPVFFMKPDIALLRDNEPFYYPSFSNDIHYECEVVVKISKVGKNIDEKFAHKYYDQLSLGIDFTARDLQQECKAQGLPWEIAKSFENSAPISSKFVDKSTLNLDAIQFSLKQNGVEVQTGNTVDFIFSIDKIIAYISRFMTLKTGDLIFTGTPSGVGPIKIGDKLTGYLESEMMFEFEVK